MCLIRATDAAFDGQWRCKRVCSLLFLCRRVTTAAAAACLVISHTLCYVTAAFSVLSLSAFERNVNVIFACAERY